MSFSNILEAAILDHIFGESVYTAPTWYAALSTADPGEDGSTIAELSGSGYTRKAVGATTRTVSSVVNDAAITFPTATGDWSEVTHVALFDDPTAGNFLGSVALDTARTVLDTQVARFDAGELEFTQD